VAGARARLLHRRPGVFIFEIGIPEGPGSALRGPRVIDGALSRFGIEERAVAVLALRERNTFFHTPRIQSPHFVDRLVEDFRDLCQLVVGDPDDARCAGAAIAALRALKAQAVFVPRRSRGHSGSV